MMYAVSFRIPFTVMGMRQYVNGCVFGTSPLPKGAKIQVVRPDWTNSYNGIEAEVIESIHTSRSVSDFGWRWSEKKT